MRKLLLAAALTMACCTSVAFADSHAAICERLQKNLDDCVQMYDGLREFGYKLDAYNGAEESEIQKLQEYDKAHRSEKIRDMCGGYIDILREHEPPCNISPGSKSPRDAPSSPTPTSSTPTTAVPALDRPPAMPQPTGTGPVTMYDKGLADRNAWENWFNGLQGDVKTGAFFWAGQRSLPHPGSCSQMNADFHNGCTAAKERLATADALRTSEPDYKRGWNAYVSPGAANTDRGSSSQKGGASESHVGENSGGPPQDYSAQDYSAGPAIPLHEHSAASVMLHRRCRVRKGLPGPTSQTRSVSRSTRPYPPPTALLTEGAPH